MNRTTQVYRDPPSEIRWYWIFIVSKLLLDFVWIHFRWIISLLVGIWMIYPYIKRYFLYYHLKFVFDSDLILCSDLCSHDEGRLRMAIQKTTYLVRWVFKSHMRENKRWQFNGNAFTSGVHTLENKMPLFLLAPLLVFAFLYSLRGKKICIDWILRTAKRRK